MLGSKKFEKTILLFTIIALIFSLFAVCCPDFFSEISNEEASSEYPIKLFGQKVIEIEISANENDWNEMLENKMDKPYIACDLNINGKKFSDVGLRPKGNSSLTSIRGDRISFRLDFDHYIDNQTCYGLEQMVLNNLQADATYMKDYIAYDLMAYEGVNAPLHTYAFLTLNGKPFGVYLAVEVYDEDYLTRVYNDTDIKLYNVKSSGLDSFESAIVNPENGTVVESNGIKEATGMGGLPPGGPPPGEMGEMPPPPEGQPSIGDMPQHGEKDQANAQPPQMSDMQNSEAVDASFENRQPPPGAPGGSGGGDLVYVDDSTDSYNTIFANAVSKKANAKDFAKVIRAIKYLNKENVTNEELEQYWDVDAALRYLAVHTFMVNGDSYTGNMKQNYYLAEKDGRITILPWDYNLSFGSFGGGPGMPGGEMNAEENNGMHPQLNETTKVINHAIDTPTIDVDMESRPLVSVLLSREEYKERYHRYLEHLVSYTSGDFINKLETIENSIYPYVQKETVTFYTSDEHRTAFDVVKQFLVLRSLSIRGQLNGEIPSETEKQSGATLITADFSINDMGSMGGPGGAPDMPGQNGQDGMMPPPPPGMQGENGQGGMPPPPPGMQDENGQDGMPPPPGMQVENGQGGMMPPPDMPGMMQTQDNTGYYVTIIFSMLILCVVFIGVKLFKRNY